MTGSLNRRAKWLTKKAELSLCFRPWVRQLRHSIQRLCQTVFKHEQSFIGSSALRFEVPTRLYAIHIIVSGRHCILGGDNRVPKVQRIVSALNGFPLLTQLLDEFLFRICR